MFTAIFSPLPSFPLHSNDPHQPPPPTLSPPAPICPSPLSRWETSWGRCRQIMLWVQTGSAPGSSSPMQTSYTGLYLHARENLLCGTSTKDPSPKGLQQLQTSCSHFTPEEDTGAACPCPSPASGGSFYGPAPVCLLTWQHCRQITDSPGKTWKHCVYHVLWFFQCFQHHTACTSGGQVGAQEGGPALCILDPRLPHQPATVCEDSGLYVALSCLQYWGPTGNSLGPLAVHPVHCRPLPTITPPPSTKVIWQLCYHREHTADVPALESFHPLEIMFVKCSSPNCT